MPNLHHGRQDLVQSRSEEHPPTIKANKARSARKLVARARQVVAVTLITEFKVYLTQQFRKKTLIARKSQKQLIQQFENHANRDSLIKDLNKTEEFNPFQRKVERVEHQQG